MKILISGVSSGIGLSLARYLKGDEIWGISRRAPTVDLGIRFSHCNVTDWLAVSCVASELQKTWDSLDAIIHCAATQGAIGPAMEVDPEKWLLSLSANVDGAYYVMRAFFEQLVLSRKKGRAKIVLFSGGGAAKPRPNFSAYGAAKTLMDIHWQRKKERATVCRTRRSMSGTIMRWQTVPAEAN